MAKRFTDTEKWNDPWHRKELKPAMKCFWDYINAKCDRSGVWKVDMEQAAFFINEAIDRDEALAIFGEKRVKILTQDYWQILGFIPFQYGVLSPACKSHRDVFSLISSHQPKGYSKPFQRLKDKETETDKDKDQETERAKALGENGENGSEIDPYEIMKERGQVRGYKKSEA